MTEIEIRIPLGLGEALQDIVYKEGSHEYVAFGLVSHAVLGGQDSFLLRRVLPLPESAYQESHSHGAQWSGAAMAPVISQAVDENLGIVLFHSHQHDGPPRLSADDLASADRLLPIFRQRVPGRPHGSIVLSRSHAGGIAYMPGETMPRSTIAVRWYGATISKWSTKERRETREGNPIFQRQSLMVGGEGQDVIRCTKVAVVGLGGGGSHVVQQLAHTGIGEIIGIDADRIERTNQHRIVGWDRLRAWVRCRKVDLLHYLVWRIGTGSRFRRVAAKVPDFIAVEALKDADRKSVV